MPQFGQIRPELGRIDFSPIARGGQAFGQGVGQGLASLGAGLGKMKERRKKEDDQIKLAKSRLNDPMVKNLLSQAGVSEEQIADSLSRFDDMSRDQKLAAATATNQNIDVMMSIGAKIMTQTPKTPPIPLGHIIAVNTTPEGTVDMDGVNKMLDSAGAEGADYKRAADLAKSMSPQSAKDSGFPLENEVEYVNTETSERKLMGTVQEGPMAGQKGYVDTESGKFIPKGGEWQISYDKPATRTEMTNLKNTLLDYERSMKAAQRYMGSRQDARQGFDALADQIMLRVNTVLNRELTPEQLAQGVSEAQFQGLLGQFRLETVGGGVMTEKDAQRIIARLGGEPGLLANRELMSKLMEEIITDKYAMYESALQDYSIARDTSLTNRKRYKEWEPVTFDFMQSADTPAQSGAMPTVTSQAEYDALPSGANYVDSDGNTYKKP